jgi:hypothetical protein
MNELTNKIITFGRDYKIIIANKLFGVTNDGESYLLISSDENNMYKIYMEIEAIEQFLKNNKDKKEINMKSFFDKTYIIKDNQEISLKK